MVRCAFRIVLASALFVACGSFGSGGETTHGSAPDATMPAPDAGIMTKEDADGCR